MKKIAFMIALATLVSCGQKSNTTYKADLEQDGEEFDEMENNDVAETGDDEEFDITK